MSQDDGVVSWHVHLYASSPEDAIKKEEKVRKNELVIEVGECEVCSFSLFHCAYFGGLPAIEMTDRKS